MKKGLLLTPSQQIELVFVIVGGEYWKAKSSMGDEKINKGDKIKVVEKEADLLIVEHLHDGKQ